MEAPIAKGVVDEGETSEQGVEVAPCSRQRRALTQWAQTMKQVSMGTPP